MRDRLELYSPQGLEAALDTSIVPDVGELLSIRKATWRVVRRTYAVDDADNRNIRMRCNVDIERVEES